MNRSDEINEFSKALAKAQGQFGAVVKGKEAKITASNSYSYADLATVCAAVVPILSANEISVVQGHPQDAPAQLETLLSHSSGQWVCTYCPVFEGRNGGAQGHGSGMTYARRYALLAAVGVAPEDDDDGAEASGRGARAVQRSASDGMNEAWDDAVKDSLPENASPRQIAEAYTKAIIADMNKAKTENGVNGAWDKRAKIIDRLAKAHDDLYQNLIDAHKARVDSINEESAA